MHLFTSPLTRDFLRSYGGTIMDGSAMLLITSRSCDHHTRIYGCVLMLTTIHAMVEKDNSFDTQRMLAHGIQAAQTTLYKLIQQRDAFAVTSPYRGHTPTTHATYDFAQFSTNAAVDTSVQQTRFTFDFQNSIRSICHRDVSSRPERCRVAQQARVQICST